MRMKVFFNMRKTKRLLFCLLAAFIMGASSAWADEVTVYDGTATNDYLPVYGYYVDSQGGISEFIIPSDQLTELNGKAIERMVFYLGTPAAASFGAASFNVYLEEVAGSNYDDSSASQLTDNKTKVYEGALDATGTTMEIPFVTNYTYNGGNLLVAIEVGTSGTYKSAKFYGTTTTNNTGRYKYGSASGRQKFIPKTTFITPTAGPALRVFDGSTKISSPYSYNFGLTTEGTTKTFTLSNPGTAAVEGLSVSETGGFNATLSSTTIAVGGDVTLTVTMPATTGSSDITISSTTEGIDDFVINVSGTVREAGKIFIDFEENPLPSTWTKDSHWSVSDGKASIGYYTEYITSGRIMTDEGGEYLFFKYTRNYNSSYSSSQLAVEYATTGNGTDADWTAIEGFTPEFEYNVWKDAVYAIPAAAKYIRIKGYYVDIDDIYGLTDVPVAILNVTQPASLDFGVIAENTAKTFTIANIGTAELTGITVTSADAAFTVTGAPTTLAVDGSQEVTITMSAATIGSFTSEITVSADEQTPVTFTVKGTVLPTGLTVIDFNNNQIPNDRWTTAGNYMSFSGGAAVFGSNYGGEATLTTPKITMGQYLVIKAKLDYTSSTSYHLNVKGSTDNGETYSYSKNYTNTVLTTDYQYLVLSDIPANVNKLQFVGYYASIDEIQGINYAPELVVTMAEETVATPASYDFEECTADAAVTYNFANIGEGELNITGVAITGDGATAYSTNWTESVAVPFGLEITRIYDPGRNGAAQDAVITVTTTDGEFVINVTGTDRAANAPELTLDVESLEFGKLAANDTKTVTVTNAGTGSMSVNIASDNALFSVSPAELTEIAAGESKTFEVTFNYDQATAYGELTANITVTPTYEGGEAKTIAARVNARDPETWFEDFTDEPTDEWEKDGGWSFANGQAQCTSSGNLTTPYLSVSGTTDELTFDYESTGAYYIYVDVQKNNGEWTTSKYTLPSTSEWMTSGYTGTYTITGLEEGFYRFRFRGGKFNLDNFEGFKIYTLEHNAEITAENIASTGFVGREYTATVTVMEKAGKEEAATAKLYIAGEEVASKEVTLGANEETEIELTFTPETALSYQAAYVEVTYAGGTLKSTSKYVTIKNVTVFDEAQDNTVTSGSMQAVQLKRKFIAGWNTLCVPFDITSPTTVFGDEVKIFTFDSYSATDGLNFKKVNLSNGLDAGVPYLLYVPAAIEENLFFESVSISNNLQAAEHGGVSFQGTYNPIAAGSLTGNYVLTTSATIAKAGEGASLKAFRAYFTATEGARMSISFDDGTQGITALTTDGEIEIGTMYNLQGQKVQGTQKGLYIINGKKVVRK